MAMLLPLGIEKGKPFNPDARQKRSCSKGAAMGELMARNLQVNPRFAEPYWKDTHWYKSFDFTIPQETETRVELDERTTWFYEAVTSSEGMVNPTVGAGSGVHDHQARQQGHPAPRRQDLPAARPEGCPGRRSSGRSRSTARTPAGRTTTAAPTRAA